MSTRPDSGSTLSRQSNDGGPGDRASAPVWVRGRGQNPLGRQCWRRLAIVLLALALPATLSLLIWTVERLRLPTPAHLELVCSGYELNVQIPPNVPAKNALKRLLRLTGGKGRQWFERLARYHLGTGVITDLDIQGSAVWKAQSGGPSKKAIELSQLRVPTVIVILALTAGPTRKVPISCSRITRRPPDRTTVSGSPMSSIPWQAFRIP